MLKRERPLTIVCDSTIASDEVVSKVLSATKAGKNAVTKIFAQFTTTGTDVTDPKRVKYSDPIRKQKVCTFTNQQENIKKHQTIAEDECESLGNMLAQLDKKRFVLKLVLKWSVTSERWTICFKVDQKRSKRKYLFRKNLQLISPVPCTTITPPEV